MASILINALENSVRVTMAGGLPVAGLAMGLGPRMSIGAFRACWVTCFGSHLKSTRPVKEIKQQRMNTSGWTLLKNNPFTRSIGSGPPILAQTIEAA
jgi:hypothetical protein